MPGAEISLDGDVFDLVKKDKCPLLKCYPTYVVMLLPPGFSVSVNVTDTKTGLFPGRPRSLMTDKHTEMEERA